MQNENGIGRMVVVFLDISPHSSSPKRGLRSEGEARASESGEASPKITFLRHSSVHAVTAVQSGDPRVETSPAYAGFDLPHAVWDLAGGDSELPGACVGEYVPLVDAGFDADADGGDGAVNVQRGWSNASIAAYHDPCVPKPDSSPYFASVPVMNDDVSVNLGGGAVTTKGINVAVEDSKVVEVQLLSDGPTPGPWTMAASVFPGEGVDGGALTFEFDSKMGQNGDVRHLTVTPHQPGNIPFMVTSTLGTKQTYWLGLVGQ